MYVCSRLQTALLNPKDMCWLLLSPTTVQWRAVVKSEYYGKEVTQKVAANFKWSAGLIRRACYIKSFNCIAITALISAEPRSQSAFIMTIELVAVREILLPSNSPFISTNSNCGPSVFWPHLIVGLSPAANSATVLT